MLTIKLFLKHNLKVYNGRIILELQEIKKVAKDIKLSVLFYKVYFLTPEETTIKNSHHGRVQQLKMAALQLHLYQFCNLKLIEEDMFLRGGILRSRYCKVFLR